MILLTAFPNTNDGRRYRIAQVVIEKHRLEIGVEYARFRGG